MPPDVTWPRRTARLELRPTAEADLPRLLEIRNDPRVTRWMLRTTVAPEAARASLLTPASVDGVHRVAAVLDGVVIGLGLLAVVDGLGQDTGTAHLDSEGDLGYLLDPAYAGQGLATELARELLAVAFSDLGLRRVTAGCFADNHASWRVMEKIGMRREQHGVADSWHADLGWVDGFAYAVLAQEWRG